LDIGSIRCILTVRCERNEVKKFVAYEMIFAYSIAGTHEFQGDCSVKPLPEYEPDGLPPQPPDSLTDEGTA